MFRCWNYVIIITVFIMKAIKVFFKLSFVCTAFALVFSGCDKDEALSGIPTAPTEFSPKDGEIIHGNTVSFKALGASAENGKSVYFLYVWGTDPEELEENFRWDNLLPSTQYFWQATPYTENHYDRLYGETSPVMTFYTAPEALKGLESDNGESETQVILRWDRPDNCKKVEITFSPASNNVAQPIILPAEQDSIVFSDLRDYDIDTQSFIKYTFTVKAIVKVGDKEMERVAQIDEIPLNKSKNVRDFDYNVYTCLKIGSQIWLRENLRTTTTNDGRPLIEGTHYVVGSESEKYGLYYERLVLADDLFSKHPFWTPGGNHIIAPDRFKVASWDDWMQLFRFLGATEEELECNIHRHSIEEHIGAVAGVASLVKSRTGWPLVDGIDGNGIDFYTLSVLPGGYIDRETRVEYEVGQKALMMAQIIDASWNPLGLRFEPTATGVFKTGAGVRLTNIRCVKNLD